jgi:hypothetical protein
MMFPAIFFIIVGDAMIGQWTFSFATRQVPELKTEFMKIIFHLVAEFSTAVILIIGGGLQYLEKVCMITPCLYSGQVCCSIRLSTARDILLRSANGVSHFPKHAIITKRNKSRINYRS